MCLGFARGLFGLLGFDLESQSWLPLLPSELHLGFHLGSLGFQLGSSWAPSGLHLGFHLGSLGSLGFDLGDPT